MLLITECTYETVAVGRRVTDFTNLIGHVFVGLHVFGDHLKAAGVHDVLVLSVIVIFDRDRFDRVHRIEEVGKRN